MPQDSSNSQNNSSEFLQYFDADALRDFLKSKLRNNSAMQDAIKKLHSEHVDGQVAPMVNSDDLKALGIPLGEAKHIIRTIKLKIDGT